jgi:hypothetical protein
MYQESTARPIEPTRSSSETMNRGWGFDALAGFFAADVASDRSESHLGSYGGAAATGDLLVGCRATWEDHHHETEEIVDINQARAAVERVTEERG